MNKTMLLGMIALGSVSAIVVACSSSDTPSIASPATDAGKTAVSDAAPITTPSDAGDDDDSDAAAIDDGGANIDPDAGDDDDAGDAGPCNSVTNDAASILSVCDSQIPGLTGGALVAGTYQLTDVAALGSATFCKNAFQPTRIAEMLVLTVDANGTGTAQLATMIDGKATRPVTLTLAPPTGNASPLTQTQTCPAKGGEKTIYQSDLNQKQILTLEENYGTGRGLYRFKMQ